MAAKVELRDVDIVSMIALLSQKSPETEQPLHTKTSVASKYNITTVRLNKAIIDYNASQERIAVRKSKLPSRIQPEEVTDFIEYYVRDRMTIGAIAKLTLRSPSSVKNHLIKNNIPIRSVRKSSKPTVKVGDFLSELSIGDKIMSYYYNLFGEVIKVYPDHFRVWLFDEDKRGFFAHRPRKDLAKL